jgi:hypothetical protein
MTAEVQAAPEAVVEAEAIAAAAAAPAPTLPFSVKVGAPCHPAFQQAVALARKGYQFSDAPIEIFPNGMTFFSMILGTPSDYVLQQAQDTIQVSVNEEAAQYKLDVEAAAKAIFEQAKRDELEREVAAATAALEKQIAALKQAAAAELTQLQNAASLELARLK